MTVAERFWTKVRKTPGCWVWLGYTAPNGYGRMWGGRQPEQAHRVAYRLLVGDIPEGFDLDHLCRNRACVNPAHLEPVTRRTNVLRGVGPTARHAVATECPSGHPYDAANTIRPARGGRQCRACHREADRKRRSHTPAAA